MSGKYWYKSRVLTNDVAALKYHVIKTHSSYSTRDGEWPKLDVGCAILLKAVTDSSINGFSIH